MIVHLGSVALVGLLGVALYLLVRVLPGRAAQISRLAIGPFALFYAAGEAIQGVATGVLVEHANDAPADQRPAAADAAQAVYDDTTGEVLIGVGGAAAIVALIAAAVAYRQVPAPLAISILPGLSAILVLHAPPTGPLGLAFLAAAVGILAWSQGASTAPEDAVVSTPAVG